MYEDHLVMCNALCVNYGSDCSFFDLKINTQDI